MKKIVSIFISIIFLASSLLLPAAAEQAPTPAIDSSPMHSSENSRYSKTELRRLETLQQTKEMADGLEDSSESSANSISSSPDEPLFSEERVIVKLSSGARLRRATPNLGVEYNDMHLLNPSASTFSTAAVSTRSMTMTDEKNNVFVLTLKEPGKDAVEKALKTLRENPAVELAEPDYFRTAWSDPDTDPYEVFAADIIGAPKAWEITEGSKEIVVGIIDSGIDGTHPDLKDNLWVNPNPNQNGYIDDLHGYSFTDKQGGVPDDELGHGTHVAGIVGALGMNEYSFKGVSPKVSLAALNVSIGGSAMISDSACIEALNYADNHGIKITNNSYGGYGYSEIFEEAIENYDGLFVAAAGNESLDNDEMFAYPASYDCPNIISVASTDKNDNLSLFSNYGDETVDIAAPGEGILSTVPPNAVMNEDSGSEYAVWDGTSMASPHVAGVAALVLSENPGFTTEELRNAVLDGADRLPGLQDLTDKGRRLDAYHALSPRSPIESFSLDYKTDSLDIYDMAKINAIITPADAFQSVLWESSDPETVRISGDGYIIGLKKGTATVTARSFASPEFSANVQITVSGTVADAVPFLDFAFKQAVIDNLKEVDPETYADYALESRITREDAEKVIEIGISSLGIEDLTGLSSLVNLERLICPGNMLPELDVSKNTALIELDCSWCNIYELDLRNNPNLKILNCSGNGLSELNFSANPDLEYLDCSYNYLPKLDLNRHGSLATLICEDNGLESIKLPTSLTVLNCTNNPLTELDLTGISGLTELYCSYSMLNRLDVSGLNDLVTLICSNNELTELKPPAGLTYLDCSFNLLTELDLSGLTELSELICYYNQLNSLNLTGLNNLTAMNCSGNELTKLNLPVGLTSLECSSNLLTELDISGLIGLEGLNCSFNRLTRLDLSSCTGLSYLYCDENQLTQLDLTSLTELYNLECSNNRLTRLDLSNCTGLVSLSCYENQLTRLDLTGLTALEDFSCSSNKLIRLDVSGCPGLMSLSCGGNQLTELDVSALTGLYALDCSDNLLTGLSLSGPEDLQILYCGYNQINSLSLPENLAGLSCSYNNLTELALPVGLMSLDCSYNKLAELPLAGLTMLMDLNCSGNLITQLDLSECSWLGILFCDENQLTELNVSALPELNILNCAYNKLTDLDLSNMTGLHSLDCSNNQFTELYIPTLCDWTDVSVTCSGNRLTRLDTSKCATLGYLDCSDNLLTDLTVSNSGQLSTLNCSGNRLTRLNLPEPTEYMGLHSLICSDNQLTELSLDEFYFLMELACSGNPLKKITAKPLETDVTLTAEGPGYVELDVLYSAEWFETEDGYGDYIVHSEMNAIAVPEKNAGFLHWLTGGTALKDLQVTLEQYETYDMTAVFENGVSSNPAPSSTSDPGSSSSAPTPTSKPAAASKPTPSTGPKTGDSSPVLLWILLTVCGAGVVVITLILSKKNKKA